MNTSVKLVVDCKNTLGECCFLDPRDNALWWTDIDASRIWRLDANLQTRSFVLPGRAGFILPRRKEGFVIGFPDQLCLADGDLTCFTRLHDVEPDLPQTRINDACVDPFGGIVFGTFDETPEMDKRRPVGAVYRLGPDGGLTQLFGDVVITNGLAFSPDGTVMYFADTPVRTIRRFRIGPDFSEFDEIEPLAGSHDAPGMPDGGTVDADGNYWSARVWGGCVVRFSADGTPDTRIDLPTKGPTCVTFGGTDLTELYVTSLRRHHSEEELAAADHAGGLFSVRTDTSGIPQLLCAL
ncbi:MAG: SMP-30/gluconolactonase/LRE family protein [Paracoccaceae bacterium]|nr:SMP-30/gluconolactonase/LRE family protein [Paracoccaceae bacterium]